MLANATITAKAPRTVALAAASGAAALAPVAVAQPVLPDYTLATFDGSSGAVTNPYFALPVGQLSIYSGEVNDGFERIHSQVTADTVDILGINARVVIDREWIDGVLQEVTKDWYAQDTAGNVWYLGEDVTNFEYDASGALTGTNKDGSWIADGSTNFPGVVMWNDPMIGDEYYQEFAPGVALDFAVVNSLTDTVDIDFGSFMDVLNTGEGNLIDGPEIAEFKLYAMGPGLLLIQELDDVGQVEYELELRSQQVVPAPGALAALGLAGMALGARRRRG